MTKLGKHLYKIYMDAYLSRSERGDPSATMVSDCQEAGLLAVREATLEGAALLVTSAVWPVLPDGRRDVRYLASPSEWIRAEKDTE